MSARCVGATVTGSLLLSGLVIPQTHAVSTSPLTMPTDANVVINGALAGDASGRSVASAGDVNGDGLADVVIGAPYAEPNGSYSGSAYVLYGKAGVPVSPVTVPTDLNPATTGFRIDGAAANDLTGWSVSGAGDVNGDGRADVIIGSKGAAPNGAGSGSSYVVYGKPNSSAANIDLASNPLNPASTGFQIDGAAAGDELGRSVSGAGDVNADGLADLIVGAPGADPNGSDSGSSYVIYGQPNGSAANTDLAAPLNPLSTGFQIAGGASGDRSGVSVSGAGDVNADGRADVIVGAPNADPNGTSSGSSYVVYGKPNNTAANIDLASPLTPATTGFQIDGGAVDDGSGFAVSSAGDMNGDGLADLIVGAPYASPNGADSGSSYVVYGKPSSSAANIDLASPLNPGSTGLRIDGAAAGELSGTSVARAGDVNGDGRSDAIIGAQSADTNGANSGASYVVYGKPNSSAANIVLAVTQLNPASTGFLVNGPTGSYSGISVAGAGDVNGDGGADVIVGAAGASPNGAFSGSSYVIYGSVKPKPPLRKPQSQFPVNTRLPRRGVRVANGIGAKTRQGLPLTAKVVNRVVVRGDVRACFVIRTGPLRKLTIRTTGRCRSVRITVRYTAPGSATYLPYARLITFRTLR